MKYVFIINQFGKGKKLKELENNIQKVCRKRKIDYKIEKNSIKRSTEDILKDYQKSNNIIFAVGGDGILNRVLNGLVGTKNILGFIPYGTGNDFYKTMKESYSSGIHEIDLVKINHRFFINVACFGIDADIGNNGDIIHSKWIPKSQRYNMSLLYHFLKYKPRKMKIKTEENTYVGEYATVVVCNGKYYGGGYKVGYSSFVNDGLLDVYLVTKMNKIHMAKLILGMNKGKHEQSPHTTKISTKKIIIKSSETINSNVDGEELENKQFKIEIQKRKQKVYYDQSLIDEINKNMI